MPTTKQAILSQADAARPALTEADSNKASSAAAAPPGKAGQPAAAAVANLDKPAVERRSFEGLDEDVANGLRALCQVSHHPFVSRPTVGCSVCNPTSVNKVVAGTLAGVHGKPGTVCSSIEHSLMRLISKVLVWPPCDLDCCASFTTGSLAFGHTLQLHLGRLSAM